jgi:hypothetical protein
MYLVFDANLGRAGLFSKAKDNVAWAELPPQEETVIALRNFFQANGLDLGQIKGIIVWQGKGSFSLTRSAVVIANVLRLFHPLPSVTWSADVFAADQAIELLKKSTKPLEAQYSAAPSITLPKKG